MNTQRICITTLEFPPDVGGVGESVCRIAHMLKDSGYEVHVAVFHSKQRKGDTLRRSRCDSHIQDGVFVHRLIPALRSENPIMQDFLSEVYFLLEQLHQRFQFSLFHGFFINETGFLTTLLAKELGVPVINSVRGSDLHKHVFNPKQHGQIVWTLENSNWVTCVSQALKQRACVLVPDLGDRATAFWNSIQPLSFENLPAPAHLDRLQGTVIGSVGRFRDKKGLEFLLDACAELAPKLPSPCCWWATTLNGSAPTGKNRWRPAPLLIGSCSRAWWNGPRPWPTYPTSISLPCPPSTMAAPTPCWRRCWRAKRLSAPTSMRLGKF